VVWQAERDAFGTSQESTQSLTNNLGFAGQYLDRESGLYYNWHRYYDPQRGGYLETDPIGLAGGINTYAYVEGNPVGLTDPTGLCPPCIAIAIDIGIAAVETAVAAAEAVEEYIAARQALAYVTRAAGVALSINDLADGVPPGGGLAGVEAKAAGSAACDVAKDVTKRPSSFRKKTVQDSWDNAAEGSKSGTKACPTCGKDVEIAPGQGRRDWDVDHQPKWKDRDLSGMDRKQVLDKYNKDVRLRCPSCNRSDN
jgi:RHS repeat-associated protein